MGKKNTLKGSTIKGKDKSALSSQSNSANVFPSNLLNQSSQDSHPNNKQPRLPETLLPGYIWVVSNFFSPQECQRWIEYIETDDTCGLEYMAQRGTRYLASRECFRAHRNDPEMAQRIFERLQASLELLNNNKVNKKEDLPPPNPLSCNPNLRVYKYTKGQSFGKHIDESVTVVVPPGGYTRLTLLVYLSQCQGGATRFDLPQGERGRGGGGDIAVTPTAGTMLLHLHGDDCLLHQADPVLGGTKYVLRTDVVYK